MAFDEVGFGGLDSLFPQGNPLEFGSMLAHNPEGVIPQLAAEGITPQMFEQSAFGGVGGAGGMTSGQLLNTAYQKYPQYDESRAPTGLGGAVAPIGPEPPVSRPVQTLSFPRPPDATPARPAPVPASTPPGYQDEAPAATAAPTTADPAGQKASAQATQEELKKAKMLDTLQKALAGVRAPTPPTPIIPRPGTAGPPALRPINPQSAITALLAQALGGGKPAPALGSLIRR